MGVVSQTSSSSFTGLRTFITGPITGKCPSQMGTIYPEIYTERSLRAFDWVTWARARDQLPRLVVSVRRTEHYLSWNL